jgi:predicted  nucleic acid-binding Zn-ribbon protein
MEGRTKNLNDKRPFEERVFARFDAFDIRFDGVEARLERLEARSYDTKPIWERALAAITETQQEVGEIKAKVGAIEGKIGTIESKVGTIEGKVDVIEQKVQHLEEEVSSIKTDQRTLRKELIRFRSDMRHHLSERVDTILKLMIEDRDDIRAAEARIQQLEQKLA